MERGGAHNGGVSKIPSKIFSDQGLFIVRLASFHVGVEFSKFRNFPETPNPWYFLNSIAGTNGRRIAVQKGGVLQYKLGVYCSASLSPKFRSQQGIALQMGGILRYKLELYCQYFSDKLYGLGAPEQFS